jgi:hypothetical protein
MFQSHSWNQPVLSNECKVSCSRKQLAPEWVWTHVASDHKITSSASFFTCLENDIILLSFCFVKIIEIIKNIIIIINLQRNLSLTFYFSKIWKLYFYSDKIPDTYYICNLFQCRVTANDNGYPSNNIGTANVVIFVTRDLATPVFTNNARYQVTINEDEDVENSIIKVTATRQGLIVSIRF